MRCDSNLTLVSINYSKTGFIILFHLKSQNLSMTLTEDLLYKKIQWWSAPAWHQKCAVFWQHRVPARHWWLPSWCSPPYTQAHSRSHGGSSALSSTVQLSTILNMTVPQSVVFSSTATEHQLWLGNPVNFSSFSRLQYHLIQQGLNTSLSNRILPLSKSAFPWEISLSPRVSFRIIFTSL